MNGQGEFLEFMLRIVWYGGSTFDAWLNISAAKIASRLLNTPQATAQMGLPSAIVMGFLQLAIGLWAQSIINILYLKYKFNKSHAPRRRNHPTRHTIQLHEVVRGLLGTRWGVISLFFNLSSLILISAAQIVAASSVVHLINKNLNKRTWTMVFGAVFSISILIPSAHNYRVWSFIGVITIIFASSYLAIASLVHGKVANITRSTPHSYRDYFTGMSGLMPLGQVVVPVEIMDAMWKPERYKMAYFYGSVTVLLTVLFPTISMNINFGDNLLDHPNAISLLPHSKFRDTAIVLLLIHIFINFGLYSLPVYVMWEKLVGVHESPSYAKRIIVRIPIFIAFWVTALALPFFGTLSRLVSSLLVTWNIYIIPCMVYSILFWSREKRQQYHPFTRLSWTVDFSINLAVILWVIVVGCGLQSWGNMDALLKLKDAKLFASCYDC